MKLNLDAMRELLFVIEEQPSDIDVNAVVFDARLDRFDKNELGYVIEKLIEARLLDGRVARPKVGKIEFLINSITFEGHQFIDAIRQDNAWNKVKDFAVKSGLTTINSLVSTALDVFKSSIKGFI